MAEAVYAANTFVGARAFIIQMPRPQTPSVASTEFGQGGASSSDSGDDATTEAETEPDVSHEAETELEEEEPPPAHIPPSAPGLTSKASPSSSQYRTHAMNVLLDAQGNGTLEQALQTLSIEPAAYFGAQEFPEPQTDEEISESIRNQPPEDRPWTPDRPWTTVIAKERRQAWEVDRQRLLRKVRL